MKNFTLTQLLKSESTDRFLRKLPFLLVFIFTTYQAQSQTYLIAVGSDIYEVDPQSCTETFLCGISVNTGGGTLTSTIQDIAYHPNGNLYGIVANYFITIDLGNCTSSTIATHSTGSNSLVAAADGTLYAASGDLYTVDPNTGVFTSLGTLPCQSGGDLAFHDGDLYLTCDNGDLIKVDINNPSNSTVIGNLGTGYWHGLWTVYTDCNNTEVLVASQNNLYNVDLNNANTTLNCTLGTSWITGATMQGDFNASECGCHVDLGPDSTLCDGPVQLSATHMDYTYLWQDGSTDSTYTASIPGTYYVDITDTTDGCMNSDTVIIQGDLPPNAGTSDSIEVCQKDPAIDLFNELEGNPDTGGTWSPALNSGSGLFDPATDNSGTYTYVVSNTCGNDSASVQVNIIECDLGFPVKSLNISVFPNPSNGQFKIVFSDVVHAQLQLTDLSGRSVYQDFISSNLMQLDLSHLADGTYFLHVQDKKNQFNITHKIQIVH